MMSELESNEFVAGIDQNAETAKKLFRELRNAIFEILPPDCILKMHKKLDPRMIGMINTRMLEKKLLSREDVCRLCTADICPWNAKVSYRFLRYIKLIILGRIYRKTEFTKLLYNKGR